MNEELRLYTFTHFMLSSIQQGIQAGHAAVELTRRGNDLTIKWAKDWKTMICLNGGNSQELKELVFFFSNYNNIYPWCSFSESNDALDGVLTSVAIVLPENIFKTSSELRSGEPRMTFDYPDAFNEWELELIDRLSRTGMAR
jgi:hypothetical protein